MLRPLRSRAAALPGGNAVPDNAPNLFQRGGAVCALAHVAAHAVAAHCNVPYRTEGCAAGGYPLMGYTYRSLTRRQEDTVMNITWSLGPLVSLIAGILILVMPRLLNYIVAAYLIVFGLLGLFGDIRFT
jgi:hypothetical protein